LGARRPGDPPSLIADPTAATTALGFVASRSDLALLIEDALRSRR
jgi:UDP-glucose 4-epimerase